MRARRPLEPLILAALLASPAAMAQAPAAEALFEQGRVALAAGDLDTACARFRASDRIEPAAGTKANLADCEQKRGHLATAWELNRAALGKLPAGDPRATIIKQRIAKLEGRLPKLVLKLADGAPEETTVREGDTTLGAAGGFDVPLPLDPGVHHLIVTAPGRAPKTLDATLVEGKTETITVESAPVEANAAPDKPVAPPRKATSGNPPSSGKRHHNTDMMVAGIVFTSVAEVAGVVGPVLVVYDRTAGGSTIPNRFGGNPTTGPGPMTPAGIAITSLSVAFAAIGIPLWVAGGKGDVAPSAVVARPAFAVAPRSGLVSTTATLTWIF